MRVAAVLFAAVVASAQTYNFENGSDGWTSFGSGATVHVVRRANLVKSGVGALAFEYEVAPKNVSGAIVPTPGGIPNMQSVAFWMKSSATTAVAVLLSEKKPGGGDYSSIVWSPAGEWHRVELRRSDFQPNDGPTDPPDENGKLDLDQVQAVAIVDLAYFLSSLPDNPDVPIVIDHSGGKRTILLDDFNISADGLKAVSPKVIDDFSSPTLHWMTLGGATLKLSTKTPVNEPALEASYEQRADAIAVIVRRLPAVETPAASGIEFDIASTNDADVMISIEEHRPGRSQGPRFNYTVDVSGARKPIHKMIRFSDFKPEDLNSDAKLDSSRLKTMSIIDITAASSGRTAQNTLWIGRIVAAEPATSAGK